MNSREHIANGDGNLYELDKFYKEQEYSERALENFQSDIETLVCEIDVAIERMKEIAKGYNGFDFDDEIREQIEQFLPYKKKEKNTCENCNNLMNGELGLWCVDNVMIGSYFNEDECENFSCSKWITK